MNPTIAGGCACGAIRYRCLSPPLFLLNCHCLDCQRQSGAAFASGLIVALADLTIEGEVRWYESKANSGHMARRGFCPSCGSQLFAESVRPGNHVSSIRSASLDDSTWFKPQADIFTRSAQPWVTLDPTIPKFDTTPQP